MLLGFSNKGIKTILAVLALNQSVVISVRTLKRLDPEIAGNRQMQGY